MRTCKIDVLVLHLKLCVLDPHDGMPVINFEGALKDGAHAAESEVSEESKMQTEIDGSAGKAQQLAHSFSSQFALSARMIKCVGSSAPPQNRLK